MSGVQTGKWPRIALGEIAVKRRGSVDPQKFPDETFELYSIPAHDAGRAEIVAGADIGSSKQLLEPDDVVISRIVPHIQRVWIVGPKTAYRQIGSGEWIAYRSKRLLPQYLRHALLSPSFHASFMSTVAGVGGSLLRARPSAVAEIEISCPPLDQQRRIAAILDKADGIRRKRQQALALADDFLRSAFLEMFGDPVTNPKGLPIGRLGDFAADVRYGTSQKCSDDRGDGLPVLRIPNVVEGRLNWSDLKYTSLPAAEVKRLTLQKGDILFVRTNGNPDYIGRCAVFSDDRLAIYASYLIRVRLGDKSPLLPDYVQVALSLPSYRARIRKEAKTTAGNFNINSEGIGGFQLPLAPLDQQRKFIRLIEARDAAVWNGNESLREANHLFASLSQRAFRGEL